MVHSMEGTSPSVERRRPLNDQELILQAQEGDESAFRVIYERYFGRIALYLARMVGKNEIGSELAQETFLKVWRALPTLRQTETFVPWLYRIATRVAYDYQRHEKYSHAVSYDKEPTLLNLSFIEGPEEQVAAEELLQQALARVTLKYRACVVLYHIEGCSKQKIAELLSIQESSVSTYIGLGMEEFRRIRRNLQLEAFLYSLSLDPYDAEEWRFLGCVFNRLGQYENARRAYKRAEEIDPNREDVWGIRTASLVC